MHQKASTAPKASAAKAASPEWAASGPARQPSAALNPLWQQLATTPASLHIQPKLTVGAPNDPYKKEADRVADQVMRMPAPGSGGAPVVQRKCAQCEEEKGRAAPRSMVVHGCAPVAMTVQRQVDFAKAYKGPGGKVRSHLGKDYAEYKGKIGETKASSASGGHEAIQELDREDLLAIFEGLDQDLSAGRVSAEVVDSYVDRLNQAFRTLKLDTVEAQASYLANAYVESGQLAYLTETEGSVKSNQPYQANPTKVQLNVSWLNRAAAGEIPGVAGYQTGGSINPLGDWQQSFIGRGPIQVTHRHNYVQTLAILENRTEELERTEPDSQDAKELREAVDEIKGDARQAANPKYAFLFSAAFMKMADERTGARGDEKANRGQVTSWMGPQFPDKKKIKDDTYKKAYDLLFEKEMWYLRATSPTAAEEAFAEEWGGMGGSNLQPKLTVGAPNDPYEKEADQIADQVMRMPEPAVQRKCAACEEEEKEGTVQAKREPGEVPALTPTAESRIQGLRGGGSPLPEPARSYFEPRFGRDFSGVRVHTGPEASSLARSISARAFTVGSDIVFGGGEQAGGELLAHELTHVVQQGSAGPRVQRREVVGTKASASNVLLFPETEKPTVKVDVLAHLQGGLVTDTSLRPRVSAILGPGSTLLGIAKRILPYYKAAKPSANPAVDSAVPSEGELARALLVYNQYYLGVPDNMTGFKVGLRLPLPIEIDVDTGEWVVSPGLIRSWNKSFDAKWVPLLDKAPADLNVASAADRDKAVSDFLTEHPSALGRGIALGARLLTNAFDSDQFALRLFDDLKKEEAFDVALEMMNELVNHQVQLLNSQGAGSAVLWRVLTLLSQPPKDLPADQEEWRQRALRMLPTETVLGQSAGKRPIQAFIFPGETSERALVIAGVHGSEQSGVEVVELLLAELRKGVRPHYTVVVVPKLFPDNYELKKREGATETNRNFPALGTSLDTARKAGAKKGKGPIDSLGKEILPENVMLLQLIERFRPSRVASVHGTFDLKKPGVFTDPRATKEATDNDRELALKMAAEAQKGGANVAGNKLGTDDKNTGFEQKDPVGVSLGGYGPRDVTEGKATDRSAMTVITMEVGGNERSSETKDPKKLAARQKELASLRDVLLFLFLKAPRPKP